MGRPRRAATGEQGIARRLADSAPGELGRIRQRTRKPRRSWQPFVAAFNAAVRSAMNARTTKRCGNSAFNRRYVPTAAPRNSVSVPDTNGTCASVKPRVVNVFEPLALARAVDRVALAGV